MSIERTRTLATVLLTSCLGNSDVDQINAQLTTATEALRRQVKEMSLRIAKGQCIGHRDTAPDAIGTRENLNIACQDAQGNTEKAEANWTGLAEEGYQEEAVDFTTRGTDNIPRGDLFFRANDDVAVYEDSFETTHFVGNMPVRNACDRQNGRTTCWKYVPGAQAQPVQVPNDFYRRHRDALRGELAKLRSVRIQNR